LELHSLEVVHVVVNVKTKGEHWEGNGIWRNPSDPMLFGQLLKGVALAVIEGLKNIVDQNAIPTIRIKGAIYTIYGPMAAAYRKRLMGRLWSDPSLIDWRPVKLDVFVLGEGAANG